MRIPGIPLPEKSQKECSLRLDICMSGDMSQLKIHKVVGKSLPFKQNFDCYLRQPVNRDVFKMCLALNKNMSPSRRSEAKIDTS